MKTLLLNEALGKVEAERDRLKEELEQALEAAQGIFWMAEAYADGGGSGGPERRDYDETVQEVRAALALPPSRHDAALAVMEMAAKTASTSDSDTATLTGNAIGTVLRALKSSQAPAQDEVPPSERVAGAACRECGDLRLPNGHFAVDEDACCQTCGRSASLLYADATAHEYPKEEEPAAPEKTKAPAERCMGCGHEPHADFCRHGHIPGNSPCECMIRPPAPGSPQTCLLCGPMFIGRCSHIAPDRAFAAALHLCLVAKADRARASESALLAQRAELVEALRLVVRDDPDGFCRVCESFHKHKPNCPIARVLSQASDK